MTKEAVVQATTALTWALAMEIDKSGHVLEEEPWNSPRGSSQKIPDAQARCCSSDHRQPLPSRAEVDLESLNLGTFPGGLEHTHKNQNDSRTLSAL